MKVTIILVNIPVAVSQQRRRRTCVKVKITLVNIPVAVSRQRRTADMCEGQNYIGQHFFSGKSTKEDDGHV